MTANTKMTEERAKALIEYGIRATENFDGYEHSRAKGFLEGLQAGRAEMADGKEVFEITHRVNENALTVVELESRLSHLSAVNEKQKMLIRKLVEAVKRGKSHVDVICSSLEENEWDGPTELDINQNFMEEALKLADEMGEGK